MSTSHTDDLLAVVIERLADAVAARIVERMPSTSAAQADDLLDGPAMAQRLGVSQSTLGRMRDAGQIPHLRLGRRVLYRPADVIAALSE